MAFQEKRLYARLDLGVEDGFFGKFILPDGAAQTASILNLSAGGLNAAMPGKEESRFKEGDHLMLRSIAGAANLSFLSDIKGEIRWVRRLGDSGYLSVGCRFLEVGQELRAQLIRFVESERAARGQYAKVDNG